MQQAAEDKGLELGTDEVYSGDLSLTALNSSPDGRRIGFLKIYLRRKQFERVAGGQLSERHGKKAFSSMVLRRIHDKLDSYGLIFPIY